jgi:pimeloyl-ACP methyl ester carboxylesterase
MKLRKTFAAITILLVAATLATPASAQAAPTCRPVDVPVTTTTVNGTIHGTLCAPAGQKPSTVMVLVPGATYNSTYWDFPYQPETYSYSRAMVAAGYATFAIDRLGTGMSTHPAGALITAIVQAEAVHDVIQSVRRDFGRVILTGHSLGSAIAVLEAATYHDADALVVTGMQHRLNAVTLTTLFGLDLRPAPLQAKFQGGGYDVTQLTTVPGRRYDAFYSPGEVDPKVVEVDEATKDAFATTEAPDAVGVAILAPYSALIDVPVLVAMGQRDALFCGFLVMTCSTDSVLRTERPYYAGAPSVDAFVLPGSGHDVNLSPRAPQLHAAVTDWASRLFPVH